MTFTLQTARDWASELGARVPSQIAPALEQGWMDRVYLAGNTGRDSDIRECDRFLGL